MLVRIPCPKYQHERDRVLGSVQVKNILGSYEVQDLYEELTKLTGLTIDDPDDVQSLYSTLRAEADFNLTLPEWTKHIYPDKLLPLTIFSFVLNAYNTELQKLKGGPLLKKIVMDTEHKIEGSLSPIGRKLYIYAGHDSTVTNLLMALRVWDPQVPMYNILVMVELHQDEDTKEHGIKLYLRNTTTHEPYPLIVPGCDHFCPFDTFTQLLHAVLPKDLKKDCEVDDPNYVPNIAPPP